MLNVKKIVQIAIAEQTIVILIVFGKLLRLIAHQIANTIAIVQIATVVMAIVTALALIAKID